MQEANWRDSVTYTFKRWLGSRQPAERQSAEEMIARQREVPERKPETKPEAESVSAEIESYSPRDARMPVGGRLICLIGKDRGYEVEHYMGTDYIYNLPLLRGIITNLNTEIFQMDPNQSKQEVKKDMEASGANAMLFRRAGSDMYVGFAIFRRMKIEGTYWLLYTATRGILEEDRGQHLGRFAVKEVLRTYEEDRHEPIDVMASRGQSAPAFFSIIETGEIEGGLAPFYRDYRKDHRLRAIEIALYRSIRHKSSLGIDENTGVSRKEYKEGANAAATPDSNHSGVMEIQNIMERKLRVNRAEGDGVYGLGWTKRGYSAYAA